MLYKIAFYILVMVGSLVTLPGIVARYKRNKERLDFIEIVARCLIVLSGIILLMAEIID